MAAGHNLLQLDLARTASAQRARPIYRQSLCPSCPSEEHCLNAFSRQTQEVFAYHQHKNDSVGMCWDTFDSTPGVVFRLCFSDTFQTLAVHRYMCLPKHRIFEANIMTIFNLGSICGSLLFGWAGILKPRVPCAAAAWCSWEGLPGPYKSHINTISSIFLHHLLVDSGRALCQKRLDLRWRSLHPCDFAAMRRSYLPMTTAWLDLSNASKEEERPGRFMWTWGNLGLFGGLPSGELTVCYWTWP